MNDGHSRPDWHCPRCIHQNRGEDRFCWFCRWDAEAEGHAPTEWQIPPPRITRDIYLDLFG